MGFSRTLDGLFFRYKTHIFIILCGYFIAAHYWFLGFNTWDGLSYRIPPIVEFVQHGSLGGWKFNYTPAKYFYPFFEWVHVPFLKLLDLPGLYFSFSLTLLPLSIASVYLFVRELTGNISWATYSALVYLALPFVNTQPFSGYIDFAVIGALAFFLYAVLKVLRSDKPSLRSWVLFTLATFVFSMSRQQTPYLALFFLVMLTGWFVAPWNRSPSAKQFRVQLLRRLPLLMFTFILGMGPAAYLHIGRYLEYGSPIYPYQFKFYEITSQVGFSQDEAARGAGLLAPNWNGLLVSFRRGWIWPGEWPRDLFDSRLLGAGLFFWLMWITLPILDRIIDRNVGFLVVLFALVAILVQDFWLPRWSMTLVLAVIVCVAGALASLATKGPSWAYGLLLLVVLLHIGRPLYDAYGMIQKGRDYIRINLSDSPLFIKGEVAPGELKLYPDLEADFWVVHPVVNEFTLLLYGRSLSNQIAGVLKPSEVDDSCTVNEVPTTDRQILFVDQQNRLAMASNPCEWVCVYPADGRCLAGKLIVSK